MEVKINREILSYNEALIFGLSLRQCVCAVLAMAVAAGLYLLLRPAVGGELISWICILGAAPFAIMGFFSYHGMTAERFFLVWFRSQILEPRRLCYRPVNLYYEAWKEQNKKKGRGGNGREKAAVETKGDAAA